MKNLRNVLLAATAMLIFAGGAGAQMMGRGMGHAPMIPGMFKPMVGSGAEYQITMKNDQMDWQYAVVGKETVDGSEGYWLEMRMKSGKGEGAIMKQLVVTGPEGVDIKRMIMQAPGQPPMEMPMGMMSGMMKRAQKSAAEHTGEKGMGQVVGTESVTVPAGTFECTHYRSTDPKSPGDFWVATQVYPYGLVKMTSQDTTMVLQKVLENQTSQIKGEPQKVEMPHF
jgi:hypothetical protein